MKKTWKITALATAITIMSISVLGCGAKDNADTPASPAKESESGTEKTETEATESTESTDTAESADSGAASGDRVFTPYEETVEISSVKNLGSGVLEFPEGDSLEDNAWTRYLEET